MIERCGAAIRRLVQSPSGGHLRWETELRKLTQNGPISLRPYAEADWPEVFEIVRGICEAGDTFCYPTSVTEEQAQALWLVPPPGHTTVAVDRRGRIVGTGHMGPNRMGPGGHIATGSFMVKAGRRDEGIGRLLVENALDWARQGHFRGMQFNAVAESNGRAIALYQSLGFEIIGTVPEGFLHPDQGHVGLDIMYKVLA